MDFDIQQIIFRIYLGLFAVQAFYIVFFFSRVGFSKPQKKKAKPVPVSIVICARDEASNLQKNLPAVLNQDYYDFEVVVVNDCSEDHTATVLEEFEKQYTNLKVTTIKKDARFAHGKKLALTIGIKAASHEWLLLTDADCKPGSSGWVSRMQKNFTQNTDVVLGYGGFTNTHTLLNTYTRYETLFIAMQYFGFALAGIPYMGVGRNLAYRKSLFFKHKGFASHRKLASGDDDLFVNEVATKSNTRVEFSVESHTRSEAKRTLPDWVRQKKRHLTTGFHYNRLTKLLLGGEYLSRVLFFSAVAFLALSQEYLYIALGGLLLRWVFFAVALKTAMKHLNEKDLFLPSLIFDLISPLVNILLVISNRLSSPQAKWK